MLKALFDTLQLDSYNAYADCKLHEDKLILTALPTRSDAYKLRDAMAIIDKIDTERFTCDYRGDTIEITLKK